jgi:hypothetical protein
MNLYPEKKPKQNQTVVAYCKDHKLYFAVYKFVWTWKGKQFKFVNIASKGFWDDSVIGWNRIPQEEETI